MKNKIILLVLWFTAAFVITGCQKQLTKQYNRQLPPGELALRKITNPDEIPDLTDGCFNIADMSRAIDNSLNYLRKPSSKQFFPYGEITHQHAVESLKAFKKLINSGLRGPQLNDAICQQFDIYTSVGCDYKGTVLFTGYYTPIFNGSSVATEQFKYPLYSQPTDLVKNSMGQILGRRMPNGEIKPYPQRAEIETSDMLKGNELIWLADPFDVYIAHVQGSAKIRLPNGKLITTGYAANNGYEYRSISEDLVEEGKIKADQLSLSAMIDFFRKNVNLISEYTRRNPRFVFFCKDEGPPRSSINEPVITLRTIATDKSIYPRACLAFISTTLPRAISGNIYHDPYKGFALDQDTGGAIRAPGRCDVYMGQGDTPGKLAGQIYQEGRLYYLFLKKTHLNATMQAESPSYES
jgi:membrane-bound lytic murein transglycosylase A